MPPVACGDRALSATIPFVGATRLDPLVRLREREEERARLELARAIEATRLAREALEEARRAALRNEFAPGPAYEWEMRELAHRRALEEVERAKAALLEALEAEEAARRACEEAHKRLEAVRRVAEARKAEARAEAERQERKLLDEIGSRSWSRRSS